MFAFYAPMKFFSLISVFFWSLAFLVSLRVVYFAYFIEQDHWQIKAGSLALVSLFTLLGFFSLTLGVLGINLAGVREMLNKINIRQRQRALKEGHATDIKIMDNTAKESSNEKSDLIQDEN